MVIYYLMSNPTHNMIVDAIDYGASQYGGSGPDEDAELSLASKRPIRQGATLLSLLQRAASLHPRHGLVFRDANSESGFNHLSYSELLDHANVSFRCHC